jgi:hypothetical protein
MRQAGGLKLERERRQGPLDRLKRTLARWQTAPDLAGLCDPKARKKLPAEEREAWARLWADSRPHCLGRAQCPGQHPLAPDDLEKPRAEAESGEHRLRLHRLHRHRPILRGHYRREMIAGGHATTKEKPMRKKTLWTLVATIVGCGAPSTACAQAPGAGNPWQGRPALPGLRDREDRKDRSDAWPHSPTLTHLIPHAIPHGPASSSGADAARTSYPSPPRWAATSGWKSPAPRFSPALSEGVPAVARGVSRGGRGILAAIGGGIAALFGGLFGRKKQE